MNSFQKLSFLANRINYGHFKSLWNFLKFSERFWSKSSRHAGCNNSSDARKRVKVLSDRLKKRKFSKSKNQFFENVELQRIRKWNFFLLECSHFISLFSTIVYFQKIDFSILKIFSFWDDRTILLRIFRRRASSCIRRLNWSKFIFKKLFLLFTTYVRNFFCKSAKQINNFV